MVNGVYAEGKAKAGTKSAKKIEVAKKAEELPENIKLIIGQGKTKNYYMLSVCRVNPQNELFVSRCHFTQAGKKHRTCL